MRKVGIEPRRDKSEHAGENEYSERKLHVSQICTERLRQVLSEELADEPDAFTLCAIDPAVGTDDEAVEVIDELRIAALGACDGEIGRGPAIELAEFAHL